MEHRTKISIFTFLVLFVIVLYMSCAPTLSRKSVYAIVPEQDQQPIEKELYWIPEGLVGMTEEQVLARFGQPKRIHRAGTEEWWLYDGECGFYFKNGIGKSQ